MARHEDQTGPPTDVYDDSGVSLDPLPRLSSNGQTRARLQRIPARRELARGRILGLPALPSLNRAGTGRYYHAARSSAAGRRTLRRSFARSRRLRRRPSLPAHREHRLAGFGAPSVAAPAPLRPAYLSRPVALASAPARDFSAAAQANRTRVRRPQLTGWIRRRYHVACGPPDRSGRFSGYVAAALLAFLLLVGALIITTVTPICGRRSRPARSHRPGPSWTPAAVLARVDDHRLRRHRSLALLFFSLLIGLATHNAVASGRDAVSHAIPSGTAWLAASGHRPGSRSA